MCFQKLKRHFARYTPEMSRSLRHPAGAFHKVADTLVRHRPGQNGGDLLRRWLDATLQGVQIIRTASILQLLLGNIGRPGGGILALRGHASIQARPISPRSMTFCPVI